MIFNEFIKRNRQSRKDSKDIRPPLKADHNNTKFHQTTNNSLHLDYLISDAARKLHPSYERNSVRLRTSEYPRTFTINPLIAQTAEKRLPPTSRSRKVKRRTVFPSGFKKPGRPAWRQLALNIIALAHYILPRNTISRGARTP